MAALVQTYPQQTGTVTMLQTRPTSTNMMPSQGQTSHQYMGGSSQAPRSTYGSGAPAGYRGSSAPVQPYAFTSTPTLNRNQSWQQQTQQNARNHNANASYGTRQYSSSMTNLAYNPMGVGQTGSRDDTAIPPARNIVAAPRPQSAYLAGSSQQSFAPSSSTKAAPDRYRRMANPQQNQNLHGRSQSTALAPNNGMLPAVQMYNGPNPQRSAVPNRPNSFYGAMPGTSMDDMHVYPQSLADDAKRLRRRSMHSKDYAELSKPNVPPKTEKSGDKDGRTLRVVSSPTPRSRSGSSESVVSSRSSNSRPSSVSSYYPLHCPIG